VRLIALYAQHQNEIAVVLLDLMMRSLDTSTIIQTSERINPQVKIIAMNGLFSRENVSKFCKPCPAKVSTFSNQTK